MATKTTKTTYGYLMSKSTEYGYDVTTVEVIEGQLQSVADMILDEERWLNGEKSSYVDELRRAYKAGVREMFVKTGGKLEARFLHASYTDPDGGPTYCTPNYKLGTISCDIKKALPLFAKVAPSDKRGSYRAEARSPAELIARFKGAVEMKESVCLRSVCALLRANTPASVVDALIATDPGYGAAAE